VIAGNLTRDPEVRYTGGGTPVATLGLAINNRVKKGDEWTDEACFIDVVLFGKQAEYMGENSSKGSNVVITGRLQYRNWEGNDGNKRSKLEVVAERVQNNGKSSSGGGSSYGEHASSRPSKEREPGLDDDVPF
jgi:single-strand DNA-binding protein